jgi:hypothetical protein
MMMVLIRRSRVKRRRLKLSKLLISLLSRLLLLRQSTGGGKLKRSPSRRIE